MPVSYPLMLPALSVTQFQISIARNVAVSDAPFSGHRQVYEWPSAYWVMSFSFLLPSRRVMQVYQAFLDALHDQVGSVLAGPVNLPRPMGTANLSGVTATGTAGALTVQLQGLGANRTLLAGDMIQIGIGASSRLHRIVTDGVADSSGVASVDIEPPLRTGFVAHPVTLAFPKGVFALSGPSQPMQRVSSGGTATLSLREVL